MHLQLSEADIIEELERMCNPMVYEGLWITHYDMVENGDKIDIVDKGQVCTADTQRSVHLQPHCAGLAAATNPMIISLSSAALGADTSCGTADSSAAAACNSWQVASSVCISGVPASGMAASLLVYNLLRCLVCLACALQASTCNSECATIARACSQISDDLDLSDLSEALFAGKSRSALHQLVCYEQSNACSARTPPVPKVS